MKRESNRLRKISHYGEMAVSGRNDFFGVTSRIPPGIAAEF